MRPQLNAVGLQRTHTPEEGDTVHARHVKVASNTAT